MDNVKLIANIARPFAPLALLAILLLMGAAFCAPGQCLPRAEGCSAGGTPCCPPLYCDGVTGACAAAEMENGMFDDTLFLCAIGGLATALLIALAYIAGEFLQNPKLMSYAKAELLQVMISIIVAIVILSVLFSFSNINVKEISAAFSHTPFIFSSANANYNVFEGAILYLEYLQGAALRNIASLRFDMGAYETRLSYNEFLCDDNCWLSMISTNIATYGGEAMHMSLTNNLLSLATVSYLSAVFQYFTLQYIVNGLFLSLLPIAIVMRAIPFMKNFGGALCGIVVALYILYPFMLLANAFVAPALAEGASLETIMYDRDETDCAGIDIFRGPDGTRTIRCIRTNKLDNFEWDFGGGGGFLGLSVVKEDNLPSPSPDIKSQIKTNILIFLTAVFLPALNFIVIAALARDISAFLGDEAEISRLGQMI